MSSSNKAEQAVALAALILADESIDITPEKLQILLRAAGIEDIEPIWATLFAKALEGKDVKDIITTVGSTTNGGVVQGSVENGVAQSDEPQKDVDDEPDYSSDDDIGMSLFD